MKILTIDSASESFSVSIFDEDKILSEVFLKKTGKQLTYLAQSLDYAFLMSGLDRKDIELVCVSSGPGSFTGIRLAEVTAMTFSQIMSVPVAPINTLDSVYEAVKFYKRSVAVAFDARRDEIFTAIYGDNKRLTDYLAVSVKEFMLPLPKKHYEPSVWKQQTVGNDYLISDGLNKYSVPFDLIGEQVQISEIAEHVSLSRYYFTRLFRKETGRTPNEYLAEVRINFAREMLIEKILPVAEIAERCGFANTSHFTRFFREKTGQTPAAFRKSFNLME